jgi:hypothetical protein
MREYFLRLYEKVVFFTTVRPIFSKFFLTKHNFIDQPTFEVATGPIKDNKINFKLYFMFAGLVVDISRNCHRIQVTLMLSQNRDPY